MLFLLAPTRRFAVGLLTLFVWMQFCNARIHKLQLRSDIRQYIGLSTFGFYEGGVLEVEIKDFRVHTHEDGKYGFTLERLVNEFKNPYLDDYQDQCLLTNPPRTAHAETALAFLILNLQKEVMEVACNLTQQTASQTMHIYSDTISLGRVRRDVKSVDDTDPPCKYFTIPIEKTIKNGINHYNTRFMMMVSNPQEEGLYQLFFHNCQNYGSDPLTMVDFDITIGEKNMRNYLSAGEMPLPAVYVTMAVLFFISGCFWLFLLRTSRLPVFKIHYLMAVLVFLKSFSLLFHGINFHYIQTKGEHVAAWAILFYSVHLLKGAVLFITILLIGSGWTFIKHILTDKEKKLFMIVIPLQVLDNIAHIVVSESELGDVEYKTWKDIFIVVDLLCCACIIFPVVWSINHLQEASQTDGKAAINLRKLMLFRQFYVMVVCYIYFTRLVVYLLQMILPFQYDWLHEMFREMTTYVFYVVSAYKFKPASANPYFLVNYDDYDDDETDIVLFVPGESASGLTKLTPRTTTINESRQKSARDDEENLLKENSLEYD